MRISVITPCHPRNRSQLQRTLQSLEAAGAGLDVERLVIFDDEAKGPSWARNRGLDQATGDYVFFVDADDTVRPDFFRKPVSLLESTGADLCLFGVSDFIPPRQFDLSGRKEIHEKLLNSFIGYSMDDVRRWNRGGILNANRTLGSVGRCAFRREFLNRHGIRFNERISFYEDSVFVMRAVAFAERALEIKDVLFDYEPQPSGNFFSGVNGCRHWKYKLEVLRERLDLESKVGDVWRYCDASAVLGLLEMVIIGLRSKIPFKEQYAAVRAYLSEPKVRKAFRDFPLSLRHPLMATAVILFRLAMGFVR